jgi:hypothetical protein
MVKIEYLLIIIFIIFIDKINLFLYYYVINNSILVELPRVQSTKQLAHDVFVMLQDTNEGKELKLWDC